MCGFPALLERWAGERPDDVAVRVDGGGALTFARWHARAVAVARAFEPGARVGLRFDNRSYLHYAVAYVAALRAGAVAVPLPRGLPAPEVERMVAEAGLSTLVSGLDGLGRARRRQRPPPRPGPGDLAEILFTSGSTGAPKAVAVSHANLAGEVALDRLTHRPHDTQLHAIPVGTNWGQFALRATLSTGMPSIVMPAFDPQRALELVELHRPTELLLVPTMAVWLLEAARAGHHDVGTVATIRLSGAAVPPALLAELRRAFPTATVHVGYSSTEASPACTMMEFPGDPPDTVGRAPAGHEVQVVGPNGEPLPAGRVGEIRLRSTTAPARRYLHPGAGEGVFDHGGWVRTGDLGSLDAAGYLRLRGRKADVINVGGSKVHAAEVEASLLEHPAVVEAAVFGAESDSLGEQVVAAVVLSTPVAPGELRRALVGRLAAHKVPSLVHIVEELPRNRAGKVSKPDLRRRLRAERASARPVASRAVSARLLEIWREVLGADDLDADADLAASGAGSLEAFAVLARVRQELGVAVPPSRFIVVSTIRAQARLLAELT